MSLANPVQAVPRGLRVLFRGGTVLTMDPLLGDFARADVLVDKGIVSAIGPSLDVNDADVVDAHGTIIIPGFCDPHIHAWEGALGRLIPRNTTRPIEDGIAYVDAKSHPTRSYFNVLHSRFGPQYDPQDVYVGTLVSLYAALDGGITTVCDNMHNTRGFDHSVAAVEALRDSGVRGIHAAGMPTAGGFDERFFENARRLRDEFFSSEDQDLTMRLYGLGGDPVAKVRDLLRARRELDLWVTFDSGLEKQPLREFYETGEFDGRETLNHGHNMTRAQRELMRDGGSRVNVCPRIETQFRRGSIPFLEWTEIGVLPGISNDNPATYAIDMFAEMHTLFDQARAERFREGAIPETTLKDILAAATIRGADNCGLRDVTGSLTVGKAADLVVIDTSEPRLTPVNNAYATVVQGAHVGSVRDVMVAGRFRKWAGRLVDVDMKSLAAQLETSRERLFERAGWELAPIDLTF